MIENVLKSMIDYFGDDVRRINHALKVYGFASTIARCEKLEEETVRIVEVAAVLHDIGIPLAEKKYNCCTGKYQELEGPPVARKILEDLDFKAELIERVCFLIGNHHSYSKIDGKYFQILVEADFLVNIYEDEMDQKSIASIREKYIRTEAGEEIFDRLYPLASSGLPMY